MQMVKFVKSLDLNFDFDDLELEVFQSTQYFLTKYCTLHIILKVQKLLTVIKKLL